MKTYKLIFALFLMIAVFDFLSADGFIVNPRPVDVPIVSQTFPLEVKYHYVDVKIKDQIAETLVQESFFNPSSLRLEGYYLFPVPKNAIIKKFSMFIDGKETNAELLDAEKARNIYEEIVRKQKDPALLEYIGQDVFKVRIFPIDPHSEKKINISYFEILNKDNNAYEYIYPLNTEKFSSKPLENLKITVDLETSGKLKNIYSTSHETKIIRKNDANAQITLEMQNIKPDTDFNLYFNSDNSKVGLSLLANKENENDGFFFLDINPGLSSSRDSSYEKDITFAADTSGSMAGKKLEQLKKALIFCINNLNKNDRFEVIKFSTEALSLFNKLENAGDKANIDKAVNFINKFEAIGGTNIEEALKLSLAYKKENDRPHIIIFITDGTPTIGETNEENLLNMIKTINTDNSRIFTFGIGVDLNTHLLDKITESTKAYRTYISPDEDIEVKISNFYSKVKSPVLTNLKISFSGSIKTFQNYPVNLPDLFEGASLTLIGKYNGSGNSKIILEGKIKNDLKKFEFDVAFPQNNAKDSELPSLWASRRIGYLLDQIRLHGENKELIDEVAMLSRAYGIITPYTSYLILEDETNKTARRELDERYQTIRKIVPEDNEASQKNKKEFFDMKKKSGEKSIQASTELQNLIDAVNKNQTSQGKDRMIYKDQKGISKNLTEQVKNIHGRAFYLVENSWIDSNIQNVKNANQKRIQFLSKEYFDLLNKSREFLQYLALGKNVRFVLNKVIYEIYE